MCSPDSRTAVSLWALGGIRSASSCPTLAPQGFAAIHLAAQQGQLTCLQILIDEYEFPVDLPTHGGETALHLVIHKDNEPVALPCIQYLLEKGASLDA